MTYIAICGFKSSGKDTIGDYLIQNHGFTKLSFADALKHSVSAIFGWSFESLLGATEESRQFRETVDPFWTKQLAGKGIFQHCQSITPRDVLQLYGTAMRGEQMLGGDIWINALLSHLQKFIKECKNVVITDCRFTNEWNALKVFGFELWNVHSAYATNIAMTTPNIHISETQHLEFKQEASHVLQNNGTKEKLYQNIEERLNQTQV